MRFATSLISAISAFVATLLAGSPVGQSQEAFDALAWRAARDDGSVEAYHAFLQKFPTSQHANEAFRAMVAAQLASRHAGIDAESIGSGQVIEGAASTLLARLY